MFEIIKNFVDLLRENSEIIFNNIGLFVIWGVLCASITHSINLYLNKEIKKKFKELKKENKQLRNEYKLLRKRFSNSEMMASVKNGDFPGTSAESISKKFCKK